MHEGRESASREFEKGLQAKPENPAQEMGLRTYILVWLGIIILTGITYTLSRIKIEGWEVIIALVIAGAQAALALNYFMHLKSETAGIFKVIIPLVLAVLIVFMALTFSDVAFRRW